MGEIKDPNSLVKSYATPDPNAYTNYQREIYGSFRAPKFSTKPEEWEKAARSKIPEPNFLYVLGSASKGRTYTANIDAFDRYRLRPRMLVNATRRDVSINLFGRKYDSPLLVAPIGVQSILHADGEEATARACRDLNVPMILSTAATRTIEQIAAANGSGPRWYQLYWPRPQFDEVTISLLDRAKNNGFEVLVVTLDTFNLAWRPNDLDTAYLPFIWGQGCEIGLSDPVFNRLYDEQQANDKRTLGEKLTEAREIFSRPGSLPTALKIAANVATIKKSQAWLDVMNSGTYREWKHLEILKKHWKGPIVLKGIQTVEDARKAAEYGMDGIVVSNHGGRQLDGAIASLDALAEIAADATVKSSNMTLLFDSGIRTGSDILKALALGANAVLVGRPYAYGLAMGGEEGVKHVLRCLLAEMDNMLGNLGKTSLSELSEDDLRIYGKL
jgi:lactate 2-monooxygenase